MRVLYVAPRYHTNQADIIEGWLQHGDEVFFLSQYVGKSEDYSCIKPEVIGYSKLFKVIEHVYVKLLKRKDPYRGDWKLKSGFPPLAKLKKRLKEIKPDVAIIRERSAYTIVTTMICRYYHIPTILYNQSPVWDKPRTLDWKHKMVWKLVPEYRITPVLLTGIDFAGLVEDKKACWLPFVIKPQLSPSEKRYFAEDNINILSIGKFEQRKNHFMLLKVFEKLIIDYSLHLTIVGECSNQFHEKYLEELRWYINEHHLAEKVTVLVNLSRDKVFDLYRKTDVFVLPSTGEPAAVSHLEAMAFSIPAVCSTGNGTASYILSEKTGFVFEDQNADDLELKLRQLLKNRDKIKKMGSEAYRHVQNQFQFAYYYEGISEILGKINK